MASDHIKRDKGTGKREKGTGKGANAQDKRKACGIITGSDATGHDQDAHGRAVPAHHARGEGRGRRGPVDHARAVSVVPPDPADREARLAGAADLRRQPRRAADRRRRRATAHQLQRRGPDACRGVSRRAARRARTPGAIVGSMVGIPPLIAGEWIALPFAVGCGFAGGGLREICPKEAIWHFSPLFFTDLHRNVWRLVRRFQIDWVVILLAAPIGLEIIRQALGSQASGERQLIFYHEAPNAVAAASSSSSRRCCASPSRSRSGTARASSTGCRNRRSC